MDKEPSSINPWLRANLDTFDLDTLNLIPEDRRPEYGVIQHEIAVVREALNGLLARRYQYLKEVSDGNL